MKMEKLYERLAKESTSSAFRAIDLYNNGGSFKYRERDSAIYLARSWELMLKAVLLKESGYCEKSIYRMKKSKHGGAQKEVRQTGKGGFPLTIALSSAINKLVGTEHALANEIRENLEQVIEIRNNAIHFVEDGREVRISKETELATCCQNYFNYRDRLQKKGFFEGIVFKEDREVLITHVPSSGKGLPATIFSVQCTLSQSCDPPQSKK